MTAIWACMIPFCGFEALNVNPLLRKTTKIQRTEEWKARPFTTVHAYPLMTRFPC